MDINLYVALAKENQIFIDWWDYDKYNKGFDHYIDHSWTLDGGRIVHGAENTIRVISEKSLAFESVKAAVEQFRIENKAIIRTITFYKQQLKEEHEKISGLVYRILPKLWVYEDLPFKSMSTNLTVDGRLFAYLNFEEPYQSGKRSKSKYGHVCPKCVGWNVKKIGSTDHGSGRGWATWTEQWSCDDCGEKWDYRSGWSD